MTIKRTLSKEIARFAKRTTHQRLGIGMEGRAGEFLYFAVEKLVPFHNQARKVFAEDEIKLLAESIKQHGIRQPLTVTSDGRGNHAVVSGERRLRAAKMIGLQKVPCIVLDKSSNVDAISLIENIHRKDLHPIELGIIYKRLLDTGVFKNQSDMAEKIAVHNQTISEYIKYNQLPQDVIQRVIQNGIIQRSKIRKILNAVAKKDNTLLENLITKKDAYKSNISNNNRFILKFNVIDDNVTCENSAKCILSENGKKKLKQALYKYAELII